LLLTVASTLRERDYVRRQVRTLSAEGRLSAWILGGLPIAFMIYLLLVRPSYVEPMFTTTLGGLMLAVGAVMLAIGGFVMSRLVKIEI
jgi:tight adherence protein B